MKEMTETALIDHWMRSLRRVTKMTVQDDVDEGTTDTTATTVKVTMTDPQGDIDTVAGVNVIDRGDEGSLPDHRIVPQDVNETVITAVATADTGTRDDLLPNRPLARVHLEFQHGKHMITMVQIVTFQTMTLIL